MRPTVQRSTRPSATGSLVAAALAALFVVHTPRAAAQQATIRPGPEAQHQRNQMKRQLRQAMVYEEAVFSDSGAYTADLSKQRFLEPGVALQVALRDTTGRTGYTMVATRPELPGEECRASVGDPDPNLDGVIVCGTSDGHRKSAADPAGQQDTATGRP